MNCNSKLFFEFRYYFALYMFFKLSLKFYRDYYSNNNSVVASNNREVVINSRNEASNNGINSKALLSCQTQISHKY